MRTFLSIALSLSFALAACGGADKADPQTPTPDPSTGEPTGEPTDEPQMMDPAACEAAGGSVVGDIGDGSVACPEGTTNIGNVSGGVEQQLCCQPSADQSN
jgi:hypothetical protein